MDVARKRKFDAEPKHSGVVENRVFAKGSRSEHTTLHLVLADGETLQLRRRGQRAFGDEVLEKLLGKRIVAMGRIRNGVLFLKEWHEEDVSNEAAPTPPPGEHWENSEAAHEEELVPDE